MSTLTLDGNTLVFKSPYNRDLVDGLKAQVPPSDRQWDQTARAWRVTHKHAATLVTLTEQYLGEKLVLPALPQKLSMKETRVLDVRYIGTTKERGSAERSAFGWSAGTWSVVFPEAVLREWFDAPSTPDQETNLYQVLAVKKDADTETIKKAYRRLARQWHPDVCREPGSDAIFRRINDAYTLLSDPRKRARYDAGLALTATLSTPQRNEFASLFSGYRSPLRCGLIMCEGTQSIKFVVESILAWKDVTNAQGQILTTSWPVGSDSFLEVWA